MSKLPSRISLVKNVTVYSTYLILVWAFYRFLFQFPDEVEELIIKPIVWLIPLFYLVKKEGFSFTSLGFTFKNLFPSIYLSIGLGAVFVTEGLITNYLKYKGFNFGANIGNLPLMTSLGLSFATAFSEESAFRGYLFTRLLFVTRNELTANLITTTLWTGIHIPIAFFIWKLNFSAGLVYSLPIINK